MKTIKSYITEKLNKSKITKNPFNSIYDIIHSVDTFTDNVEYDNAEERLWNIITDKFDFKQMQQDISLTVDDNDFPYVYILGSNIHNKEYQRYKLVFICKGMGISNTSKYSVVYIVFNISSLFDNGIKLTQMRMKDLPSVYISKDDDIDVICEVNFDEAKNFVLNLISTDNIYYPRNYSKGALLRFISKYM